jgi:hypothetical protein
LQPLLDKATAARMALTAFWRAAEILAGVRARPIAAAAFERAESVMTLRSIARK